MPAMLPAPRTGDRLLEVLPPLGRLVQQPKARIGQFSRGLLNAVFFLLFEESLYHLRRVECVLWSEDGFGGRCACCRARPNLNAHLKVGKVRLVDAYLVAGG
jgi:hypothetical protein